MGCRSGDDTPAPGTAVVELEGRRTVVDLGDCGLRGDHVYLAGRGDGVLLQAVVAVSSPDGAELAADTDFVTDLDGAGLTVSRSATDVVGAFGADAYAIAGFDDGGRPPPGAVTAVLVDGAHVRFEADVERLDPDTTRGTGEAAGRLVVDANCP